MSALNSLLVVPQAHVKAQVSSKTQLLDIMSKRFHELQCRLDDMLSRIARETEEIKDLEQQLTDGQIAANEALKQDLEAIISGLQEYLCSVKDQARATQRDCQRLQRENESLQHLLKEKDEQCSQLQDAALSAEKAHEVRVLQSHLQSVQGQASAYEARLEAQLQARETEATQLKEELSRLRRVSQMEHSAMHAELEKERQAKEKAADLEQENKELLKQLSALQEERSRLKEQVSGLQGRMAELQGTFLCPREVQQRLEELRKNITTGKGVISSADILGRSLLQLQQDLQCVVSAAQTDRDEALRSQDSLSKEMASLRDSLRSLQDLYNLTKHSEEMCGAHEAEVRRLEEELQEVHEQQYLMAQRLEEAEDEREHLQESHSFESHTAQLQSLDLELQELRRSFATADKMAAMHLNTAKNQLHSLHSTAKKISQERAQQLESTRIQAAQAAQDLEAAEAEIRYVQRLLRERVGDPQTHINILQQQNSYLSSGEPRQSRGYWYYVPTAPIVRVAPSLGSQGTQDSGLGSQYPPSPERVHHTSHRTRRERVPPASGGYWVYSPHIQFLCECLVNMYSLFCVCVADGQDSVCESGTNDSTSESNLTPPHDNHHYTLLHDCTPLPPGTFVYTSAVAMLSQNGDNVSYGPHTSRLTVPFIPAGVLHCNMLGHQDMVRNKYPNQSMNSAEIDLSMIRKLRELERRVREKESSETGQNDSELQRDQLQQEIKALRRSLNRLQHQRNEGEVLKEVECVEKTLMRRRAELREADRRLLLAQSDLKDTHKHVEDTEREMEEMEHRAQDCATQLVHTKQQLRYSNTGCNILFTQPCNTVIYTPNSKILGV
uniref:Uncharacterized protein n=1 Tax=Denticeps clupeoides TaxID=299321 RepID=A0AAY4ET56_9TELE